MKKFLLQKSKKSSKLKVEADKVVKILLLRFATQLSAIFASIVNSVQTRISAPPASMSSKLFYKILQKFEQKSILLIISFSYFFL